MKTKNSKLVSEIGDTRAGQYAMGKLSARQQYRDKNSKAAWRTSWLAGDQQTDDRKGDAMANSYKQGKIDGQNEFMEAKTSKFVSEILKDLKNTSKYLSEAYIFNEGEPVPAEGGEMQPQGPGMEGNGEPQQPSEQEQNMMAQQAIGKEPIIGKMRDIAIEGLKKYADEPMSSAYAFFKKVLLEADKVIENATGGK